MKQCPKCQAEISDTAKFCMECGFNIKKYEEEQAKPKARFCPECGTEIPRGAFCPECGYHIGGDGNSEATDPFGDDWLSELESSTSIDVVDAKTKRSKEQMERSLAAFEYEEHTDGTYTIVALKDKHALNITVPEGVVAIADHAFEQCDALNVSLPEGLLKIGDASFKNSQDLSKINLPESLFSIGNEAFRDCTMLNIEISASVKKVGKDAIKNTATDIRRMKEEEKKKAEAARKKAEAEEKRKAEEVSKAKATAKEKLGAYNNRANYRKAEIKEIEAILKKAESDIDTCTDIQAVERVVSTVKVKLDAIKTDAILSSEEKQKLEKRKAAEEAKRKAMEEAEKKQRAEAEARLSAEYQALFDQQEKERWHYAKYQCEQLKKHECNAISLGMWPQSEADPNVLIEGLQDANGYYFGKDVNGEAAKFAKINGKYYKVEPILWGRFGSLNEFMPVRILDCMRYDNSSGNYAQSEILAWLNGEFYQKAFTDWEKCMLFPNGLPECFVHLPPDYDANRFDNPNKVPTAYAKARGAYTHFEDGKGGYWLHSSQYDETQEALELDHDGVIYRCDVTRGDLGVVPYIIVLSWKI